MRDNHSTAGTALTPPLLSHYPRSAQCLVLQCIIRIHSWAWFIYVYPSIHSCRPYVSPCPPSILYGLVSIVQGDKAMGVQPVYQPARQGGHPLLFRVCPTLPSLDLTKLIWPAVFNRHLLYTFDSAVIAFEFSSGDVSGLVITTLSYVSLFTLCPRFILSVRELYACDGQRHRQWESTIDSGFGVLGQSRANMEISTLVVPRPMEMQVMVVGMELRDS